ncbi:hypothetical protein [Moorena producens]|uniref:hypothetical protein n=1 Tax=Moorena producens TaxID=1155739 RepID=UPI0013142C24|nr:hypothetical protein [Moorena producens]
MQRCDPWRIKFAYGKRTITVLGVSPMSDCMKTQFPCFEYSRLYYFAHPTLIGLNAEC